MWLSTVYVSDVGSVNLMDQFLRCLVKVTVAKFGSCCILSCVQIFHVGLYAGIDALVVNSARNI